MQKEGTTNSREYGLKGEFPERSYKAAPELGLSMNAVL